MIAPRRIQTAGLTINLRVEGQGPPLLFLGGSNFDLSIKAPVFDTALVDHFTVAAADPRGLGQTDAPDGDWTMADYAEDAVNLLDALGWDRAFVLGESFGAMTALHLATSAPSRIIQLALAAGTPGGLGGSSFPIETLREIIDPTERATAALSILDTRFAEAARYEGTAHADRIMARIAFEKRFIDNHNNATGYPRLLAARAMHDCWDALANINIHCHVFAGEFDGQAPKQYAQAMAQALPDAEFHIISAGHNLCFASDELTNTLIAAWSATPQRQGQD
jgi:3-oxoadipate enol-lactonase